MADEYDGWVEGQPITEQQLEDLLSVVWNTNPTFGYWNGKYTMSKDQYEQLKNILDEDERMGDV